MATKFLFSRVDQSLRRSFVTDASIDSVGQFMSFLPEGTQIDPPTTLAEFVSSREDAVQTLYPDFDYVYSDELGSLSTLDNANSTRFRAGSYEWVVPAVANSVNGMLQTDSYSLSTSVTEIVVFWASYTREMVTRELLGHVPRMTESLSSALSVSLSLNGGSSFTSVNYATPISSITGSDMVLRFENSGADDQILSYYCVAYR